MFSTFVSSFILSSFLTLFCSSPLTSVPGFPHVSLQPSCLLRRLLILTPPIAPMTLIRTAISTEHTVRYHDLPGTSVCSSYGLLKSHSHSAGHTLHLLSNQQSPPLSDPVLTPHSLRALMGQSNNQAPLLLLWNCMEQNHWVFSWYLHVLEKEHTAS